MPGLGTGVWMVEGMVVGWAEGTGGVYLSVGGSTLDVHIKGKLYDCLTVSPFVLNIIPYKISPYV